MSGVESSKLFVFSFSFSRLYLHADQKLSPASLAVVLVKADLPFDCIGSLPPTALRALGVDMFSPHAEQLGGG